MYKRHHFLYEAIFEKFIKDGVQHFDAFNQFY